MWYPISIKLTNFGSHKETSYLFINDETTMVYGKNLQDEGADSNGSGKSTIIRAISIALVGFPNKDISKEDYIMDEKSKAIVEFSLENKLIKKRLSIKRTINRSSSDTLQIFEDDIQNKNLSSVAESEARVIELLDITKEDILNYFIINQDNSHSFFKAGDNDKKKIISRFTNSSIVDTAISFVDIDLQEVEAKINSTKNNVGIINGKVDVLMDQIEYEKTERVKDTKQELASKLEELTQIKQEVDSIGRELINVDYYINKIKLDLETTKKKVVDESSVKKQLSSKKLEVIALEDDIRETKKLKSSINNILSDEIKCPNCSHTWSTSDPDANIAELKDSIKDCDTIINSTNLSIKFLDEEITSLRLKITKASSIREELEHCEKMIRKHEKSKQSDSERLETKKQQLKSLEQKIKEIKEFKQDTKRIKYLTAQLDESNKEIEEDINTLTDLDLLREQYMFWKINFGMSGFKTYLVNKVLSSVEGYVNFNLSKFKTNLLVKINGYKVLKSGKVSEKIDVLISKNGGIWNKFNRFSGGQKNRINVAGIITLQKLINMSSKSGGLNLLCLDEFLEGLDKRGTNEILKILKQSGVTTIVISHLNNEVEYQPNIIVYYENSISRIN